VCRAQAELPRPVEDVHAGMLQGQVIRQSARAIRGVVVDDEDVKGERQDKNAVKKRHDIVTLVVRRDHDRE
jgi:hypothetical protein